MCCSSQPGSFTLRSEVKRLSQEISTSLLLVICFSDDTSDGSRILQRAKQTKRPSCSWSNRSAWTGILASGYWLGAAAHTPVISLLPTCGERHVSVSSSDCVDLDRFQPVGWLATDLRSAAHLGVGAAGVQLIALQLIVVQDEPAGSWAWVLQPEDQATEGAPPSSR